MKRFLFLILSSAFISCNENSTSTGNNKIDSTGDMTHSTATDTLVTNNKPVMLSGCYEMVMKNDTATLNITLKDSTITGNLQYHFQEKDSNSGTLKGVIRDSYIYADYTFQSEGATSVREVVFKIEGDTLIPAFGDITEQGGKFVFTNKNALQYQPETPFLKVACSN